jgi:signal transduction histidine kinase
MTDRSQEPLDSEPHVPSVRAVLATDRGRRDLPGRILEITLAVLLHRDEDKILEIIGQAMVDLFPVKRTAIYLRDPVTSNWHVRYLQGYPEDQAREIRKVVYDRQAWKDTLRIYEPMGMMSYFAPGEYVVIDDYDDCFYRGFPKEIPPRQSIDDWHMMDFIDVMLFDKNGHELGCIEILETADHKKLSAKTISNIEILASIASIAVEMSSLWHSQEAMISANSSRARAFARMLELATRVVTFREGGRIMSEAVEFLRSELQFTGVFGAAWSPAENAFRVLGSEAGEAGIITRKLAMADCDTTFRFTEELYWVPMEQLSRERMAHAPYDAGSRADIGRLKSEFSLANEVLRRRHDLFVVPLRDRSSQIVGLIYASERKIEEVFEKDLLELMSVFGSMVSLAFRNAGLIGEIVRSNEDLEMLNHLLFHDMSNYNTGMDFYVQMAGNASLPEEQRVQALAKARKQLELSNDLISRIKKLAFIREKGSERMLNVDLVSMLRSLADEIRDSRADKRVTINLHADEQMCMTRANELLHDLFQNLLGNSIKYTPKDTVVVDVRITKVTEQNRDWWDTAIVDYGVGIPDDKKELIFTKFAPRVSGGKGIGLGLSIVKTIVDNYGGRIWVEDRIRGDHSSGSVFHVLLPTVS